MPDSGLGHSGDSTDGLPDDLARVLRDQSIIVPQDAAVFDAIARWAKAPSNTATADVTPPKPPVSADGQHTPSDTGQEPGGGLGRGRSGV